MCICPFSSYCAHFVLLFVVFCCFLFLFSFLYMSSALFFAPATLMHSFIHAINVHFCNALSSESLWIIRTPHKNSYAMIHGHVSCVQVFVDIHLWINIDKYPAVDSIALELAGTRQIWVNIRMFLKINFYKDCKLQNTLYSRINPYRTVFYV